MPQMKTIRQVAAMGILSEHFLRLRQKQGRLPGIYSGNRFLVNVDALSDMLSEESAASINMTEVGHDEKTRPD